MSQKNGSRPATNLRPQDVRIFSRSEAVEQLCKYVQRGNALSEVNDPGISNLSSV